MILLFSKMGGREVALKAAALGTKVYINIFVILSSFSIPFNVVGGGQERIQFWRKMGEVTRQRDDFDVIK